MHRRNYDETSLQLQRTTVAITMKLTIAKIYAKPKTYDADVVCAMKNRGNLRRKSVVIEVKIHEKFIPIATKIYAKPKTYDADVVCATKNRSNLR
jgi:hypothetical protein